MDIIHSVVIGATPERVLETVTSQNGLAGWWTPAGLAGWWTPDTKAEARVGAINEHGFADLGSLRMRVDALESNRVVWSAIDAPEGWKAARITFTIKTDEDGTNLEFRQGPFADNYSEVGMFNYLWGQYMRSLKLFAETGVGEPFGSEQSKKSRTTPA